MTTGNAAIDPNVGRWVRQERRGHVGLLYLNRPEARNAIDLQMLSELEYRFAQWEEDRDIRSVIITGSSDGVFSAGGDIRVMRDMTTSEARVFVERGQAVLERIERSRLISIAAINGYALGGGAELALACDIRVASEKAVIGFPEVSLGLYPGWGGTQRASRLAGPNRAKLLILSGDRIPAQEALTYGLVDKVVPDEALLSECERIAERIAENSPQAVRQAKMVIEYGWQLPLIYGLRLEIEGWMTTFATADRLEGLTAFLERRKPRWTDA